MELYDSLFSTPAMTECLSARRFFHHLLAYEAAWAEATAAHGLIPQTAAQAIVRSCQKPDFDWEALTAGARLSGNLALPFVQALTADVAAKTPAAAAYVHWGATSQDLLDTALMLQLREALALIDDDARSLIEVLRRLCRQYRDTPMIARTLLQQAQPTTFGLKLAGWLVALHGAQGHLKALSKTSLALQFGGASGTLSALGKAGLGVNETLAGRLDLTVPTLPWHAHRQRIVQIGAGLGLLMGTLGKIACDLSLMGQTEIAEASEPWQPGRGGSSAMPHKRNPVGCGTVLAAAMRAPGLVGTLFSCLVQAHERGLGGWHAEWETLPELCRLSAGAVAHLLEICTGLQVDTARMQEILARAGGLDAAAALATALAPVLGGREIAHERVTGLCANARATGRSVRDCLLAESDLRQMISAPELARIFDTSRELEMAGVLIDRALRATDEVLLP